jgi:hypothetical protein
MKRKLIDLVRKNKVTPPTKYGFTEDKWRTSWETDCEKTDACKSIYEAGLAFGSIFAELRKLLVDHYDNAPKTSNVRLLRSFVAITNHDREVLFRTAVAQLCKESAGSSYSKIVSNNVLGNELTIDEVAHSCVDGISKAIYFSVDRIKKGNEIESSDGHLSEIDFVLIECLISQIYSFSEDYWAAIIWRGYHFEYINGNKKRILIKQPLSNEETSLEISQIRKLKLSAQGIPFLNDPEILQYFDLDRCIYPKKEGRRKKVSTRVLGRESKEIRMANANFRYVCAFLSDEFPDYYFSEVVNGGFTLNDVLNVYRCLMLYAHKCVSKYPNNDSITSFNKACEFCHTVGRNELITGLNAATQISRTKLSDILDFLTFDVGNKKDIWANPILLADGEFLIASSVLVSPNVIRSFEHWIVQAGFDLSDKGTEYESNSLNKLSSALQQCRFSEIVSKPYSKRFKFTTQEEEIDLLIKVGNTVLVGEIKSIVTTDSPISSCRTLSTLRKAAKQAARKVDFVRNHSREIFSEAGWNFLDDIEYQCIPIVLNSSSIYVGLKIDSVPVVDFRILNAYFSSSIIPLVSSPDESGSLINLAYYELYSNEIEFEENLPVYLNAPPQINDSSEDFSYKSFELPAINENIPSIVFESLVYQGALVQDRVDRASYFPLKKSDEYEDFIKKMHMLM